MRASEHGGRVPEAVGSWSFNDGGDVWRNEFFPTREGAIAAGRGYYGGGVAFDVGLAAEVRLAAPDASDVIESLAESACDRVGDVADEYLYRLPPGARAELDAELRRAVAAWLTKHDLWPQFFTFDRVERVPPPEPKGSA